MNKQDFKKMCGLMLASVVLLIMGTLWHWWPMLTIAGAILPLWVYHKLILFPRAHNGLSSTTIDSVYYFGFLITVAALSVSAFMVGTRGAGQSMNTVVMNFGAGLIATAYAVIARMHLQSRASHASDLSMEASMEKYVAKSGELVNHIQSASEHLSSFSREIVSKTIEASELTRIAASEKMLDVTEEFSEQMTETLEDARQGVQEFRALLNSTAFASERAQYVDSLKETVLASAALNKVLADLLVQRREEVSLTQQNLTSTTVLAERLDALSARVHALGAPEGAMAQSTAALLHTTSMVTRASHEIADTVSALEQTLVHVEDNKTSLRSIAALSKRAADQIEALGQSSTQAAEAAQYVSELADSAKLLVRQVRMLDGVMETLSGSTATLASNFGRADAASSNFDLRLAQFPAQAEAIAAFGTRVEKSLEAIASTTEKNLQTSETLAAHSDNARQALQHVSALGSYSANLDTSVVSLQSHLNSFAKAVADAQTAMLGAAASVQHTLNSSAPARAEPAGSGVNTGLLAAPPTDNTVATPTATAQAAALPDPVFKP